MNEGHKYANTHKVYYQPSLFFSDNGSISAQLTLPPLLEDKNSIFL